MFNALIIVWRESLEAMLVIGVLFSWIARQPLVAEQVQLKRGLWSGAGAGILLALAVAYATFAIQSEFGGLALERFQLAMVLIATGLILHMVVWMHRHGRTMKRQLESRAESSAGAFGIAAITTLAVAREGAETVIFLYGLGLEASGGTLAGLLAAALAGFVLAGATAWLVARGARFLNYRRLFQISEILLLLIAHALLANGVDRLIGLDWLPTLLDPVWDSSALLADGHGFGRFLADFVGYRARPAGSFLIASLLFWSYAFWQLGWRLPLRRVEAARA
ncbi:MAG TPA: FTR1 family protein [Rhodocyclaceae bacterium]|nr:FTR1 family protein [Rhodocyclaceae bacterium]